MTGRGRQDREQLDGLIDGCLCRYEQVASWLNHASSCARADIWKGLEIEKLVESERFTYNLSTWQYEEGTFLFFFFDGDDDCYFHRSYWFDPYFFQINNKKLIIYK